MTWIGVVPGAKWLNAAKGTIVSPVMLIAAPVEALPCPVLARLLLAWLRASSVVMLARLVAFGLVDATTVPTTALVELDPLTAPPAVET